jgi:integrase
MLTCAASASGDRRQMHFLTAGEVERLAEAITEPFRVAIYAAAYLGLRDGELWAIRTSALNMTKGTLSLDPPISGRPADARGRRRLGMVGTLSDRPSGLGTPA